VIDAYAHLAPMIDTDRYMGWLRCQVEAVGVTITQRRIEGRLADQQAALLAEFRADAIVNATGLGAAVTHGRPMYPLRGALCGDGDASAPRRGGAGGLSACWKRPFVHVNPRADPAAAGVPLVTQGTALAGGRTCCCSSIAEVRARVSEPSRPQHSSAPLPETAWHGKEQRAARRGTSGDGPHRRHDRSLQALVGQHPLRERFREHLMLALYRCGRQADALAVYRDARHVLSEGRLRQVTSGFES
jgi:hypothetical protein